MTDLRQPDILQTRPWLRGTECNSIVAVRAQQGSESGEFRLFTFEKAGLNPVPHLLCVIELSAYWNFH